MSQAPTDDPHASTPPAEHTSAAQQPVSDNASAWKRLAREGYRRTAEQVRATCAAPLQDASDTPSHTLPPDT